MPGDFAHPDANRRPVVAPARIRNFPVGESTHSRRREKRTAMNARIDSASRVIRASPTRIFDAYMNPASLARWLPPTGMSCAVDAFDARPGGVYRMTLRYERSAETSRGKTTAQSDVVTGRFLELIPGERIRQLVEFESDDPSFAGTMTITWSLQAVADGTRVTIDCENVPEGIRPEDHEAGLNATLANLAAFVETNAGG
ncbi:MAG TPA: SRPBCC family protein [Pseudoxanthomonas sp.]|nr:SRPBCC family protein [Pseudoxanthomonas sp.]